MPFKLYATLCNQYLLYRCHVTNFSATEPLEVNI